MTPWRSFEISRRFAAHHAESFAAHRWSLRHSDHEEVTNHSAHWTPLIRIHTSNGIVNLWNGSSSGRERLFDVFFLIRRAKGCRKPWCKNRGRGITGRCPSKIFLFPFIKQAFLNGQTAHTKGCLEKRCAEPTHVLRKEANGREPMHVLRTKTVGPEPLLVQKTEGQTEANGPEPTHVLRTEANGPEPNAFPLETLPSTWADARTELESTVRVRGGRREASACPLETFPSAWADARAELESTTRGEPASHCLPRPLTTCWAPKPPLRTVELEKCYLTSAGWAKEKGKEV